MIQIGSAKAAVLPVPVCDADDIAAIARRSEWSGSGSGLE
jgi:hypothetical protein